MTLRNEITGDVLELPPPNEIGESVILLNGQVLERVLYSDEDGGSVTLGNGHVFKVGQEWIDYVAGLLRKPR